MNLLPVFGPNDLGAITECTLKYYFVQQVRGTAEDDGDPLERVVMATINQLHAGGGPYRQNLPATLRTLTQLMPEALRDNVLFNAKARQMVADYHRRLKADWAKMVASNEEMALTIRLHRSAIRVEATIDRVDKEQDGGVTGVKIIASADPVPQLNLEEAIETTMLHALVAATYPHRRPVRICYLWLHHNQAETIELTEKQYRQNLARLKPRAQAWQNGEIVARPGAHCDNCPFRLDGCPIFADEAVAPK